MEEEEEEEEPYHHLPVMKGQSDLQLKSTDRSEGGFNFTATVFVPFSHLLTRAPV